VEKLFDFLAISKQLYLIMTDDIFERRGFKNVFILPKNIKFCHFLLLHQFQYNFNSLHLMSIVQLLIFSQIQFTKNQLTILRHYKFYQT